MFGLSESAPSLSKTDSIIWKGRVKSHLKTHEPGLTTIKCFLYDSGELEIPLRNRTNEDISKAAETLGGLFAQGNIVRWEVHTIPETIFEDRVA